MKNINHVTMNTGHTLQYKDDSVIMKKVRPMIQKMVVESIKNGEIEVMDGITVKCTIDIERKVYIATLFAKGESPIPLVETMGAVNEQSDDYVWNLMTKTYKNVYGRKTPATCPKAPFICDTVFPTIILRMDVAKWSGDFTKCFGIEMLELLSESKE